MRAHVVQSADTGDLGALRDAARDGRAAAMSRRRALAAGRSALAPTHERVRTGAGEGARRAPAAAADATPPAAHLGRALSMQRRRQLAQGKRALNGGRDRAAAATGARAPVFVVHRGGAR
jgi:hypothetical protein